jgi:hypothetical protein
MGRMGISATDYKFPARGTPGEERRRSPRTKVADCVYLNIAPDNGGILLDVSSTGLGFQAAAPIAAGEQIDFRLSAGWNNDIELSGELIWLDETRKRGGLRFGQLSEEVRKHIQQWVDGSPVPSPDVRKPSPVATEKAAPRQRDSISAEAAHSRVVDATSPAPPMRNQPQPVAARSPAEPASGPPRFSPDPPPLAWAPPYNTSPSFSSAWGSLGPRGMDDWADAPRRKQGFGAIALTVALLLGAAAGVFVFLNKQEAGESLVRLGELLSGDHSKQSAKPETAVAPPSAAASAPDGSSPSVAPGVNGAAINEPREFAPGPAADSDAIGSGAVADTTRPSTETGQQLKSGEPAPPLESGQADPTPRARVGKQPEASGPSAQPETKSASAKSERSSPEISLRNDGQPELELAQQYLRGAGAREDRATAAHLLWVAVGLGNTEAEVELASLYLLGDSVPGKNCEQARILLRAASNSGNPVAGQKLATLPGYGCR